jgi:hypothetical protein
MEMIIHIIFQFAVLVTGFGFGLAAVHTSEETERWREVVLQNGIGTYFAPSLSMAMFNEWRQSTAKVRVVISYHLVSTHPV